LSELRALSEALGKRQTEFGTLMVRAVKEGITNQVNSAIAKEFGTLMVRAVKESIANQVNSAIAKAVSESIKPLPKSMRL
jgi:hypothetical protein